MADFPSTNVRLNSQISPYTDTQTFPLFDTLHGKGGIRTVGTTAEMNAIFDERRVRGMMVYVSGASAYYALIGTTANSGWTTEFQIGSGSNILPLNNTFTGTNTFNGGVTFAGTVNGATATFSRLLTASAGISASGITIGNKLILTQVAAGAAIRGISSGGNYPSALFDSNTSNFRVTGIKWSLGNQNDDGLDANYETTISGDADTGEIVIGAATNKVTITPTSGLSLGNTTTAVTISGTTTVTGTISGNTASFSRLLTASGGISANGATLSGNVTAPTQTVGTNNTTVATTAFVQTEIIADTVTSFNGRTGAAQGVSAAAAGDGISVSGSTGSVTITNTGVTRAAAGTGISVSANTGTVTISNTGVLSFNGAAGAVTGASLGANTFTALNTFSAGLSASSGLFGNLQSNSGATFNADVYVGATLSVNGNLVINGTTTTINSTTITVDDKNIELGSVTSPTDTTADGGGISLKGATDKTIVWSNTTSGTTLAAAWNFNQDINLTKSANPAYYINGTVVIDGASLGPNIVNSNLTKVGTIATGVWQGTIIGGTYGGTGLSSYAKGDILYAAAAGSVLSKLAVSSTQGQLIQADGSGLFAWGDLLIADGSGNGVSTLTSGKYRIQDASTSVKGLSRYDSFNFSVAAGVVGITAIDGGSYT